MPTFIPPYLGEEIKSSAEKKMYTVLQELDMEDAYILHSLGLPKHQSKIYGEIDFVIVCRLGILCLEIKGGRVECRDGKWIFTDRYGVEHQKSEGPFAQVTGNMFSLLTELKNKFAGNPHIKNILAGCGVVFPDIEFKSVTEEIIPEIIYDNRTKDVTNYVKNVFDYWKSRSRRATSSLSPADVKDIVNFLRGNFTFIPTLSDRLDSVEQKLLRLTNEQTQIVNALDNNSHLLIEGKAGTGKTLLAMNFAKGHAFRGDRVLVLTFNKNLSKNINEQLGNADNLDIINIHALFANYIKVDVEKMKNDPQKYFTDILPEEFLDYLSALSEDELRSLQYDLIVMDEGQDIIRPLYLYSLDMLLKNGLEKGNWAVFYDANQNIYNPEYQDGMEILNAYDCTRFSLFINCRNTMQIGTYSSLSSGIEMNHFLQENGEEVQRISYTDDNDFKKQIKQIIKNLKTEKIDLRDIAFLSHKKYANSKLREASLEVNELGDGYVPDSPLPKFSTLQGFKGLDSKIVVLVDVERIHPKNFSQFMYIATTRARTLLYIVASDEYWEGHAN